MKKLINFGLALLAIVTLASCSDDSSSTPSFNLTVKSALAAAYDSTEVKNVTVELENQSGTKAYALSALKDTTINVTQGQYKVTVKATPANSANSAFVGTANVELYQDASVSVTLGFVAQSPLLIKAIHNTCTAQYYLKDTYIEIVNNSDEVQYLDGLILTAPAGNQTAQNAWQAAGIMDMYNCGQGSVLAFPGTGKEHALQPHESIIVANDAYDHTKAWGTDLTQIEKFSVCPDMSKADWEVYLDYNANDVDYETPNMKVIFYNNKNMFAWGLGVAGRSYVLAKLPEGMTPEQFAADSTYLQTTPGTTSTMLNLMIPSKFVLDAVDVYNPSTDPANHVCTFLPTDDATGVQCGTMYAGKDAKVLRRKVIEIKNGKPVYKDTNSSKDDFILAPVEPGKNPTTVD